LGVVLAGWSCGGGGSGLRLPAGPVTDGLIIVVICCAIEDGAGGAYDSFALDCD